MKIPLLQRLFRRSKTQPTTITPLLWREQRIHEDIAAEVVAHPEMCEPDVSPRPTAHLTQLMALPTRPLPACEPDAPTMAVHDYWFYEDATMSVAIGTAPFATELVEAR